MQIEIVDNIKQFRELRNEWDELLEKSNCESIFLTWEWLYNWWEHFNENKEPFIMLIKDESCKKIVGIAPFYIQKTTLFNLPKVKKIKFLGTEKVASDFLDFIMYPGLEDNILSAVYEYLIKNNHLWDMIEITDIDEGSASLEFFKRKANGRYKIIESDAQKCPYMALPSSYGLLLQSLSPNMRENLRRRMKKIEHKSGVHFSIPKDEAVSESVDNLFILHNKRFKSKEKSRISESAFNGIKIKDFHYDIASNFMKRDWLKLYFLNFGSEPIACLYAFKYKNRFFYYQSGFNPDWNDWSLGTVLFGYAIKDSINDGLKEFHYLRGNETYKSRWTKEARTTKNIILMKKKFITYFHILLIYGKRNLKRILIGLNKNKF